MTKEVASRTVIVVGLILLGTALAKGSSGGVDVFKRVRAIGFVVLVLAVLADFAPQVVGPFAILVGLPYFLKILGLVGNVGQSLGGVSAPAGLAGPTIG